MPLVVQPRQFEPVHRDHAEGLRQRRRSHRPAACPSSPAGARPGRTGAPHRRRNRRARPVPAPRRYRRARKAGSFPRGRSRPRRWRKPSRCTVCSTKRAFLPVASIRVKRRSGLTMASGRPGKPAPVPTSAIARAREERLQTQAVEHVLRSMPRRSRIAVRLNWALAASSSSTRSSSASRAAPRSSSDTSSRAAGGEQLALGVSVSRRSDQIGRASSTDERRVIDRLRSARGLVRRIRRRRARRRAARSAPLRGACALAVGLRAARPTGLPRRQSAHGRREHAVRLAPRAAAQPTASIPRQAIVIEAQQIIRRRRGPETAARDDPAA